MPKSLHSSLECPDTLADRLEGHRFGVAATAALALFAALSVGNVLSVRAEESAAQEAAAIAILSAEQRIEPARLEADGIAELASNTETGVRVQHGAREADHAKTGVAGLRDVGSESPR